MSDIEIALRYVDTLKPPAFSSTDWRARVLARADPSLRDISKPVHISIMAAHYALQEEVYRPKATGNDGWEIRLLWLLCWLLVAAVFFQSVWLFVGGVTVLCVTPWISA